MAKGEVRWFNYKKGYGFISQDGQEENDVFVHISAVKASGITKLQEGQKVEYEIKEQQNGKMAAEDLKTLEE
jgi:CspA family cold shock protein